MRIHLHRWLPTVLASLALVVALDAPTAAKGLINGKMIKKGTVASKQIKNETIAGQDVKNGTLGGAELADGSVTGVDVADGSLAGADIADGSVTGADVAEGSVSSADVGDGGLTGADVRDGSVGQADLATAAVGSAQLGRGAVRALAFDAAGSVALDFPIISANTCESLGISVPAGQIADGSLSDDVVLVTPGAFFAFNFSWTVKVEASTIAYIKMCNVGNTNVDPDAGGTGKFWDYVALDVGGSN